MSVLVVIHPRREPDEAERLDEIASAISFVSHLAKVLELFADGFDDFATKNAIATQACLLKDALEDLSWRVHALSMAGRETRR